MTMPPIHMTPNEWKQVAAILREYLPEREVWAFGSRATGKRLKKYSDLDIAVHGRSVCTDQGDITDAFDESLLPFKVEVIDLDTIDPKFRQRIERDFVPLQCCSPRP